jgi:hypothetical protein
LAAPLLLSAPPPLQSCAFPLPPIPFSGYINLNLLIVVTIPPKEIRDLRALFSTCRLMKKQDVQLKNHLHSLLGERLYGFMREEIFGKRSRAEIRKNSEDPRLKIQVNLLQFRLFLRL